MSNINNKGFTLVELIATIVILALIMGIGAYSITKVLENSKEKDYTLLIENINDATEGLYLECIYATSDKITCPLIDDNGYYNITLSDLVNSGFLKGNSTNGEDNFALVNPKDNSNISCCKIKYKYENGKLSVESVDSTASCDGTCPNGY